MGLLDDAIREHLELKRQRGADPGEVARLEREALGPPRRGDGLFEEYPPSTVEAEEDYPPSASEAELAFADPYEPDRFDEEAPEAVAPELTPLSDEELVAAADPHTPPPPTFPPEAYEPEPEPYEPDSPAPPVSPEGGASAPPPAPEAHAAPALSDETTEWDVSQEFHREDAHEHPPAAEGEEPAEDVLEETPEFLQETPEHERLWFEQRPPRDFDFDG